MLIDRIYLRNYRVFEEELDLALPQGLVGVYGPNGSGKSTLLESVLWALWGQARTKKEEVPSAGARGDCVAEVTFEHEGHIYVVRRTITGANSAVRAEVHCDGLAVAEGVRDAGRYLHSVLGMDDAAFRASVFAEQKQLAAFSDQSPAERRKLVLALLGVTPLDTARDKARADARHTAEAHNRLRAMLPDLDEAKVAAGDAEARAGAAEAEALEETGAAAAAQARAVEAKEAFGKLDEAHREHEKLLLEGKAARATFDAAREQAVALSSELASLGDAESELAHLAPLAALLPAAEELARLLETAVYAAKELAGQPPADEPAPADEAALAEAEEAAMMARAGLGSAQAQYDGALGELRSAQAVLEGAGSLSGAEDCPLCGQPLGDAFAKVQSHRAAEAEAARHRLESCERALGAASKAAKAALAHLQQESARADAARQAAQSWQQVSARRSAAAERLKSALEAVAVSAPATVGSLGAAPAPEALAAALQGAQDDLTACRRAAEEASRLRGRLERRPLAESALAQAEERAATAASLVEVLRSKVRALAFDTDELVAAREALASAEAAASEAAAAAAKARESAIKARAEADAATQRVATAQAQHAQLSELESQSVHLGRVAELLSAFRNDVVGSVGPRLAVQAAELFAELTDNEYDRLEVDAETYGLQICDGGLSYGLDRFSGSEVDLANLALRVAISEHIRFQSGGSVGLLVLDEVFGPLDEERKARMLQALEHLKGRFRQILVVTHSTDIKEQLPSAIEVVKRPGRRATARVVAP
jgi:exonuclease SbcC